MKPIKLLTVFLVLFSCLLLDAWQAKFVFPGKRQPNVLLVTIDTLRADHVGCYGYKRATTPTIDRLAKEGTLFKHAFSNIPWTTPSHYCFLTGTYKSRHGSRDNLRKMRKRHGKVPVMISEIFKSHGYATAAFVSGYPMLKKSGLAAGFTTYNDKMMDKLTQNPRKLERRAPHTADAFKAWWASREFDAPWFVWVHLYDPHSPYMPYPEYKNMFFDDGLNPIDPVLDAPGNKPKPPKWTKIPGKRQGRQYYISQYDAEIRMADDAVKKIVSCIDNEGQLERTIVVISSDHGEYLGEHGKWFVHDDIYSQTLSIPLVFKGPNIPVNTRADGMVESIDVAPTLLSLTGLPIPDSMMGRDLFAREGKPSDNSYKMVLSESPWANRYTVLSRTMQWTRKHPKIELYDYVNDPYRRDSLLKDRYQEAKRMETFATDTIQQADSLWFSPPPPTPGSHSIKKKSKKPSPKLPPPLSDKDREALKALGYIGD